MIRLLGAVLAEQNDEWTQARCYMGLNLLGRGRLHPIESETHGTGLPTGLTARPRNGITGWPSIHDFCECDQFHPSKRCLLERCRLGPEVDQMGDFVLSGEVGQHGADEVQLAVSDPSQFWSLRDWMRGQPGVELAVIPGTPGQGELGGWDVLTLLAGSSTAAWAIRTLPDFIRSRRAGLRIEMTVKGRSFTLEASNVDEVMPIVERLLND